MSTSCDVMQVCLNGHVITDRLRGFPERGRRHCDRCGALTLSTCQTCGVELPGALPVPGLEPVGTLAAPMACPICGAAFPWAVRPRSAEPADHLTQLEALLRRLPRTIRQLRTRHGQRPPLVVEDEHDLADLLRALLPLYFDEVRPHQRTPRYAPGTRTDLWLPTEGIAVLGKRTSAALRERHLQEQVEEDLDYYRRQTSVRRIVGMVYDPELLLANPRQWENAWAHACADLEVRFVIVS